MNWYRKTKFATQFFKLPDGIEKQIDKIDQASVDYYFSNGNKTKYFMDLEFKNPYGKEGKPIPILIQPYTSSWINTISVFNPQHRNISIFPYHHNVENVNPEKLFDYLRPFIYHEIAHAVDPKYFIPDWWRNRKNIPYYEREEEFDAYAKQMEIVVQSNLNDGNFNEFKQWLSSPSISLLPSYLDFFKVMLLYWYKNKPEYIKLLKQKLYNAFIRNRKDVAQKENIKRTL
jgi:hypothetical protein